MVVHLHNSSVVVFEALTTFWKKLRSCIIQLLLAMAFTTTASAECYSANIDAPTPIDNTEVGCNILSEAYRFGIIGKLPADIDSSRISDANYYYFLVRAYLAAKEGKTYKKNKWDSYALLLVALKNLERKFLSQEKYNIYQAYILYEYWTTADKIFSSAQLLGEEAAERIQSSRLTSIIELECFIKFDHPDYTIQNIVETSAFLACVKE